MEVDVRHTLLGLVMLGCGGAPDGGDVEPADDTGTSGVVDTGTDPTTPPVTTSVTDGGAETCLRVGGGNDRVRSTVGWMPTGAMDRTLQAWVRTASLDRQVAVSIGLSAPGKALFLGTDEGYLMVTDGGLPEVDRSLFVADGEWHHVAVTFDGAVADLYLDGAHGLRVPLDEVDTADGETVAGGTPTGGGLGFVGWIDDVRIYSRVRSIGEIAGDLDGDLRDVVLWWDFEVDGSGPGVEVPDASGNGSLGITGGSEGSPDFLPCR